MSQERHHFGAAVQLFLRTTKVYQVKVMALPRQTIVSSTSNARDSQQAVRTSGGDRTGEQSRLDTKV